MLCIHPFSGKFTIPACKMAELEYYTGRPGNRQPERKKEE